MRNQQDKSMKVAIAGMGAIGRKIAKALDDGIPGMALEAVAVGNPQKASEFLTGLKGHRGCSRSTHWLSMPIS